MIKENQVTTALELAKFLDVSDRHIRDLVSEGYIIKTERGKYLLFESIRGYINYLEEKNNAPKDLKEEKIKEEIARIKEDTELKKIRKMELKNQLHSAEIVKEVMTNMLVNMKGKLLSISNKLAPLIVVMDNLGEIQDTIQTEILEVLTELSEYDPEMFKDKKYIDIEEEEEKQVEPKKRGRKKGK